MVFLLVVGLDNVQAQAPGAQSRCNTIARTHRKFRASQEAGMVRVKLPTAGVAIGQFTLQP